jgi:8-oxo-dGTP pyrophosphatase MutT (NUDIX family)
MVLSSNGKRWVVPKGCIEQGQTAGETALQEAWEEAGLVGVLRSVPVGSYLYEKSGSCYHVTVFLMHVTEARDEWPERVLRTRLWLSPDQALARVEERGLRKLIRQFLAPGAAAEPPEQRPEDEEGLIPVNSFPDRS